MIYDYWVYQEYKKRKTQPSMLKPRAFQDKNSRLPHRVCWGGCTGRNILQLLIYPPFWHTSASQVELLVRTPPFFGCVLASPAFVTLEINQGFCVTASMVFIYKNDILCSGGGGRHRIGIFEFSRIRMYLWWASCFLKQFLSHRLRANFNNDCHQMLDKGAVLVHWSEVTNITVRNITSHSLKTEVRGSDGKSLLDFFPSFLALPGLGQPCSNWLSPHLRFSMVRFSLYVKTRLCWIRAHCDEQVSLPTKAIISGHWRLAHQHFLLGKEIAHHKYLRNCKSLKTRFTWFHINSGVPRNSASLIKSKVKYSNTFCTFSF